MYSQILLPRQWARIACYCRSVATIESQKPAHNSTSSDGISAPVRIPRGPTDILQALAATVGPDPTAAHYKYHDDPYLIPLSNFRKRSYALAAEAGRKAAAWIRDEHADLFTTREWDPPGKKKTTHFNADPRIDAFAPKPIYNDESKVTEEDFKYTLQNALLEDAIKVFELLGGVEALSEDMKIDFLQLLCFYNEKEPVSMEWLEERWFSANTRERQIATWRLDGLANNIFTSMQPKAPEAYCAIIQGMAKYYQAERAHELAQEAIEKGIPLSTGVFNSLLSCIGFLKEGTTLRIEALKNLLNQMNEQGLSPDNGTLTSCLQSISAWGGGRMLEQIALQIVAEFKEIGIYPGLSAYYYLLCLFCKERGPRIDILSNILNDLEKREKLEPEDAMDTKFFITAMGVCSDHLQNVTLAERIHKLLMKDDNYKLVGDAYKESIYYRHYITVNCRHAPFEKTLELLDTLVPNVYVPEPSVIEEIIKTLEVGGAGERLAQTWSQLVVFGQAHRTKLVERLLDAFCNCYQYQDEEVKSNIRSAAADILRFGQLKEEREEVGERRSPMQKLSATAVTNIVDLCSDAKDKDDPCWEQVGQALDKLRSDQAAGVPARPDVLVQAAKRAAAVGKPGIAAMAVTYLADYGFDEALTAGMQTLSLLLNRTEEEVETLLQEDKSKLSGALHPSALVIAEAYIAAKTGTQIQRSDTSSSDSDSDEFSDDD